MSIGTTITVICENSAGGLGILGEHGFAALVEREGLRLLFDTGGGYTLIGNAARLGLDLRRLDAVALSHGHHDHAGGLFDLLALQERELAAYAHPQAFDAKYGAHRTDDGEERHTYIGMPSTREALESMGARFDLGREPRQVAEGVWLSGEIPRRTPFERVPARLQVRTPGGYVPDELRDEQSLFLRGAHGLIVVMGCAHPGIVNTIEHGKDVTGLHEVQAFKECKAGTVLELE